MDVSYAQQPLLTACQTQFAGSSCIWWDRTGGKSVLPSSLGPGLAICPVGEGKPSVC